MSTARIFSRSCLAMALSQALALPAHADTLTVNSDADATVDNGECTLREAIISANTNAMSGAMQGECSAGGDDDVIEFDLALPATITLGSSLPVIESTVTINGPGADQLVVDGDSSFIVFTIENATASLNQLTVSGGSDSSFGSGINIYNSVVTLSTITVKDSYGGQHGGGIYSAGSYYYYAPSELLIMDSTISGNTAGTDGGGVYIYYTNLMISNSTVSENTSSNKDGGISVNKSIDVTITNSTISGNSAADFPGGLGAWFSSTVTLANSLIAGNVAGADPSEVFVAGDSTVVGNLNNLLGHAGLSNNEAFDNFAPGINDVNATSSGSPVALANILDTTLADNGGPTQTHALVAGSPAINAGSPAVCSANSIEFDQRGEERDSVCDIGAYEFFDDGMCFVVTSKGGGLVMFCL